MEESTNSTFFTFDSPKGQSSYIKVIGVGGGGGNAVNHMFREGIKGVDFIVCNTDMKALNASPVPNKIPLGDLGLGAGNKPERARQAAEAKADDIREAISHNTQMLFITAGMGGGTGTGAAPVIAEIAKSIELDNADTKHILVVAIVTLPFSSEGHRRREQAEKGIIELSKHVDSILVINNDKLLSFKDFTLSKAFGMANDVLLTAAKGIAEIITVDAYVNIDFQDVNTVMENSGTALMGVGVGRGENRAHEAIEAATTSVLLNDNDIRGAKNVLIYYSYSPEHEITMEELREITDYLGDKTDGTADVIWGAGADESLDDELKVTLIATGFEKNAVIDEGPVIHELEDKPEEAKKAPVVTPAPVVDEEGITIIHRTEPMQEEKPVVNEVKVPEVTDAVPEEQPTVKDDKKHIIMLDDDMNPVSAVPQPASEPEMHREVKQADALVEDIRIVSQAEVAVAPAPKATFEPKPEPKPTVEKPLHRSAFENDNDVKTVADRIRHIHDLLRSNPNGADIVQGMRTADISAEMLYEGRSSAVRESSSTTLRADGSTVQNPYFRDQAD